MSRKLFSNLIAGFGFLISSVASYLFVSLLYVNGWIGVFVCAIFWLFVRWLLERRRDWIRYLTAVVAVVLMAGSLHVLVSFEGYPGQEWMETRAARRQVVDAIEKSDVAYLTAILETDGVEHVQFVELEELNDRLTPAQIKEWELGAAILNRWRAEKDEQCESPLKAGPDYICRPSTGTLLKFKILNDWFERGIINDEDFPAEDRELVAHFRANVSKYNDILKKAQ